MWTWLYRLEEVVTGVACFVIVSTISLQVFCRYGLNHPLSWPEEVAKLAFVWGSFFGATVGVRRRAHIAIEAMVLVLSERTRRAFGVLVKVGVLTVLAVLCVSGVQMVQMASASILPAINVSAAYLYLPVPICAALMMLHFASQCWADMRSLFGRHGPVAAGGSQSSRGD
ncbi:MAG: TRAP transporter small permease [Zetaproteobacteria bacterium]|nr:MAG: TRAP transporter small permease [Zetaproteobacteria bacterium]